MDVVEKLRERYANLHPLLFLRSKEKATSLGDLFDILESVPSEYPVVWDEENRCWKHTEDLLQSFKGKME